AHRLQRSLWPVAISLYLKGDLASMYNATLMKNKEALRWYDILLMIANCKDWQLYNVTQITKFNNYEPTPNQLVSDYILQARELSEQTFDYKNRFNHIRSVIN
ncbi:Tcd3 retrotransposon gag protein, putative, partial [Candida maltosa Xu316]